MQKAKKQGEYTDAFPEIEGVRAMPMVESVEVTSIEVNIHVCNNRGCTNRIVQMPQMRVRTVEGITHMDGYVYPAMEIAICSKYSEGDVPCAFRATDRKQHDMPLPLRYFVDAVHEDDKFNQPCTGAYAADYRRTRASEGDVACVARALECLQTILVYEQDDD